MLSTILLSMLMTLLATLNVSRHLICGNNVEFSFELLTYETLLTGRRSSFLTLMLENLTFSFHWSNNFVTIDVKTDGSVLDEKLSFKMLGLPFSSKLDWDFYIISIAKTASMKIEAFAL